VITDVQSAQHTPGVTPENTEQTKKPLTTLAGSTRLLAFEKIGHRS
jgi:hypothetical protein